jgi:methyl-accepting chemotaxis protein
MDQFTQQNAAMVEETTAVSHGLRHDIEQLTKSIATFSLGEEDRAAKRALPSRESAKASAAPQRGVAQLRSRSSAAPKEQVVEESWEEF